MPERVARNTGIVKENLMIPLLHTFACCVVRLARTCDSWGRLHGAWTTPRCYWQWGPRCAWPSSCSTSREPRGAAAGVPTGAPGHWWCAGCIAHDEDCCAPPQRAHCDTHALQVCNNYGGRTSRLATWCRHRVIWTLLWFWIYWYKWFRPTAVYKMRSGHIYQKEVVESVKPSTRIMC